MKIMNLPSKYNGLSLYMYKFKVYFLCECLPDTFKDFPL